MREKGEEEDSEGERGRERQVRTVYVVHCTSYTVRRTLYVIHIQDTDRRIVSTLCVKLVTRNFLCTA